MLAHRLFSRTIMQHGPMYLRIHDRITKELEPIRLNIEDQSQMHSEHAAMRNQGFLETHFNIEVVSDKFKGKMPIQRHRMVYALINDEFSNGLHAVNISASTQDEDSKKQEIK